jgi:hypothetical protein
MSATHDPGNSPVSAIEKGVRFRAAVLAIHLVLTAGALLFVLNRQAWMTLAPEQGMRSISWPKSCI